MSTFTVVYDACVLHPAPLRDLLMHLAGTGLFRARWTNRIHEEWIRSVQQKRPDLKPQQLQRTRELMNQTARDCLVTGYEDLIESLELPDPNDRHVLAAAIRAHADGIVTFNLDDFPQPYLDSFGIEALHPDDFIMYQFDLAPAQVCEIVKQHRASLKKPQKTVEEYIETLAKQRLPQTIERLRRFSSLL